MLVPYGISFIILCERLYVFSLYLRCICCLCIALSILRLFNVSLMVVSVFGAIDSHFRSHIMWIFGSLTFLRSTISKWTISLNGHSFIKLHSIHVHRIQEHYIHLIWSKRDASFSLNWKLIRAIDAHNYK